MKILTDPSGVHHYEIEQTSGNTKTKIEVTDLTNYPNNVNCN